MRAVIFVAAFFHVLAVVVVAANAGIGHARLDGEWAVVQILGVYAAPAVVAVLAAALQRPAMALIAATATLGLALFPFSLHSFVLIPVAMAYLVAFFVTPHQQPRARDVILAGVAPGVAIAAVWVAQLRPDPRCFEAAPAPAVGVISECTSNAVVASETGAALMLAALLVIASVALTRRDAPAFRRQASAAGPGEAHPRR